MIGHPSEELKKALENLEVFSACGTGSYLSHFFRLQTKNGRVVSLPSNVVKKLICKCHALLAVIFPSKADVLDESVYKAMIDSVNVIKKYALLLHFWEGGSLEQRQFVLWARGVIDQFNFAVQKINDSPELSRFCYSNSRESFLSLNVNSQVFFSGLIPFPSSTQYNPVKMFTKMEVKTTDRLSGKISLLRDSFLPVQAEELFAMKAISLLEKYGIASHDEARLLVRGGTIHTAYEADGGIHNLTLILQPFQGRTIEIRGAFMGRIPLTDCFQISFGLTAAI